VKLFPPPFFPSTLLPIPSVVGKTNLPCSCGECPSLKGSFVIGSFTRFPLARFFSIFLLTRSVTCVNLYAAASEDDKVPSESVPLSHFVSRGSSTGKDYGPHVLVVRFFDRNFFPDRPLFFSFSTSPLTLLEIRTPPAFVEASGANPLRISPSFPFYFL